MENLIQALLEIGVDSEQLATLDPSFAAGGTADPGLFAALLAAVGTQAGASTAAGGATLAPDDAAGALSTEEETAGGDALTAVHALTFPVDWAAFGVPSAHATPGKAPATDEAASAEVSGREPGSALLRWALRSAGGTILRAAQAGGPREAVPAPPDGVAATSRAGPSDPGAAAALPSEGDPAVLIRPVAPWAVDTAGAPETTPGQTAPLFIDAASMSEALHANAGSSNQRSEGAMLAAAISMAARETRGSNLGGPPPARIGNRADAALSADPGAQAPPGPLHARVVDIVQLTPDAREGSGGANEAQAASALTALPFANAAEPVEAMPAAGTPQAKQFAQTHGGAEPSRQTALVRTEMLESESNTQTPGESQAAPPDEDTASAVAKNANETIVAVRAEDPVHIAPRTGAVDEPEVAPRPDAVNAAANTRASETPPEARRTAELPERPTIETLGDYAVKSVRLLVARGNPMVKVRLIPESLGELRLEVSTSDDGVHVRLFAANATVREALDTQSDALRQALARQGIDVARVIVSPDASADHGARGFAYRQPEYFGGTPRHGTSDSSYPGNGPPAASGGRGPSYHDGVLNILV
ncbi:MAG TPA: hypothetical protein HPP83_10530 [Candidatus Hydrogenedentes bacterium]|nr:hypothetical protein [Candidatus Hydrogenedentota bacterium]